MKTFPIGQELVVRWTFVNEDGSEFPLHQYDYDLVIRTNRGIRFIPNAVVSGNILTWSFKADEQEVEGIYSLLLMVKVYDRHVETIPYDYAFQLSSLVKPSTNVVDLLTRVRGDDLSTINKKIFAIIEMVNALQQRIDTLDPIHSYRLEINTEGNTTIAFGEVLHLHCKVYKGFSDITSSVTRWSIVRDSGSPVDDSTWQFKNKVKNFNGEIDLSFSSEEDDLNFGLKENTVFTIKANIEDNLLKAQLII